MNPWKKRVYREKLVRAKEMKRKHAWNLRMDKMVRETKPDALVLYEPVRIEYNLMRLRSAGIFDRDVPMEVVRGMLAKKFTDEFKERAAVSCDPYENTRYNRYTMEITLAERK